MCSGVWFKRQLEMENSCTNGWPYIQFLKLSLTELFRQRKGAPMCVCVCVCAHTRVHIPVGAHMYECIIPMYGTGIAEIGVGLELWMWKGSRNSVLWTSRYISATRNFAKPQVS